MTNPKEHPILFSGSMVRAILEGRKTQTRRSVKGPLQFLGGRGEEADPAQWGWAFDGPEHHGWMVLAPGFTERHDHGRVSIPCPYGVVGGRLWVRETWGVLGDIRAATADDEFTAHLEYAADLAKRTTTVHMDQWRTSYERRGKWRPSIHMPRWASRLTMEVTGVRVERLQAISEEDARAEGFESDPPDAPFIVTARDAFRHAWLNLYGAESWNANPWVWCVTFRPASPT